MNMISVVFAAGLALFQPPPPLPPPLPRPPAAPPLTGPPLTPENAAWIAANVTYGDGWWPIAVNDAGVTLVRWKGHHDGIEFDVDVRGEHTPYKATAKPGDRAKLSWVNTFHLACDQGPGFKIKSGRVYSGQNLTGEEAEMKGGATILVHPLLLIDALCRDRNQSDAPRNKPAPLDMKADGGEAWARETLDLKGWSRIRADAKSVWLVADGPVAAAGPQTVKLERDYYIPQLTSTGGTKGMVVRSAALGLSIDCATREATPAGITLFTGRNQTGDSLLVTTIPLSPDDLKGAARQVCGAPPA